MIQVPFLRQTFHPLSLIKPQKTMNGMIDCNEESKVNLNLNDFPIYLLAFLSNGFANQGDF
jgi:hypothetical protein